MRAIEFYRFELRSDSLLQSVSIRHGGVHVLTNWLSAVHVVASSRPHGLVLNLRSRCEQSSRSERQRKAWGASPRITIQKHDGARGAGDSLRWSRCRPFHGLQNIFRCAILGLAPQALCCPSLRELCSWLHEFCDAVDEHLYRKHHKQHSHQSLDRDHSSFPQKAVENRRRKQNYCGDGPRER